jgi:hypothetical protein
MAKKRRNNTATSAIGGLIATIGKVAEIELAAGGNEKATDAFERAADHAEPREAVQHLVEAAAKCLSGMATFAEAGVSEKSDGDSHGAAS